MRNRSIAALLAGVLVLAPLSLTAVDAKTSQKIDQEIEKYKPEIIKIRRFIHMNPELGNREYETAKLVAAKLTSLGFEVRTGVAKTGVVGLLRGGQPGPTVAIRADMDALPIQETAGVPFKSLNPGVMHACGHDIHTSVALGVAMVLANLKEKIRGNVKFIFQPAEEGAPQDEEGGASLMIKEGVLENPTVGAIFGLHVWPENVGQVNFSTGAIMAGSDLFEITVKGKSAHGARPQEGVDAIVLAAEIVTTLQAIISRSIDPVDPAVLTVGKIEGGTRSNIIAERVTLEGTVRALSEANRKKIPQFMESVIKGISQSFGGSATLDYQPGNPSVFNHIEFGETMLPTLVAVLGKDKVLPFPPQMISEDFAYYAQRIPGFFFFLGVKTPGQSPAPALHSPGFNPDERSIGLGIKLMCHLLLDSLEKQSPSDQGPGGVNP
jgi:amidohydrolase